MSKRIGELLGAVLAQAGLQTTADIWRISEAWSDAVGERIAAHAAPLRLVRGELIVAAPLAVWRQELSLLGPEIVANVNLKLKRPLVARIRLVAAPLRQPEAPRETRRRLRLPDPTGEPPGVAWTPATMPLREDLAAALDALHRTRSHRLAQDRHPQGAEGARSPGDVRSGRTGPRA